LSASTPVFQRNLWLGQAVTDLRPVFSSAGLRLPPQVLVTTGKTLPTPTGPATGLCYPSSGRPDRRPLIVINEDLKEPVAMLSTLTHELIHAADDCASGHGKWFAGWAATLGLSGDPTATYAGPSLRHRLECMAHGLGPYPEPQMGFSVMPSGQVAA
jgi:hypothetical protein